MWCISWCILERGNGNQQELLARNSSSSSITPEFPATRRSTAKFLKGQRFTWCCKKTLEIILVAKMNHPQPLEDLTFERTTDGSAIAKKEHRWYKSPFLSSAGTRLGPHWQILHTSRGPDQPEEVNKEKLFTFSTAAWLSIGLLRSTPAVLLVWIC